MEITKNPEDTIFAKILNMVDNSQSIYLKQPLKLKDSNRFTLPGS